jgi:hypothetical protein
MNLATTNRAHQAIQRTDSARCENSSRKSTNGHQESVSLIPIVSNQQGIGKGSIGITKSKQEFREVEIGARHP